MSPRTSLVLFLLSVSAVVPGCGCRGETLISTEEGGEKKPPGNPIAPWLPQVDAGSGGGGGGGGGGAVDSGTPVVMSTWCGSDCDCPGGTRCVSTNGELPSNSCETGPNTCVLPCATTCGSGTQCVNGTCAVTPCVGANCPAGFPVAVAGSYDTLYQLDIHEFAGKVAGVGKLINLLSAAFSGNANCGAQVTAEDKLLCIVVSLVAQNLQPPPWVQSLLNVLADLFKFGNHPVTARGVMQLAETSTGALSGAELWSELWLNYNGQVLNVMNSPLLGANGKITVTVKAFGGTRDATQVMIGPRDIEFDVNKLIVNLLNVAIQAASNNQAKNVEDLIVLALCDNIPVTSANYAVCLVAAQNFADQLELPVGLGGIHFSLQKAQIFDVNPADGLADALGTPLATGSAVGTMSNGLVTGALGSHPATFWYGTRK